MPHHVALERIQQARRRRAKHGIEVTNVASGPADLLGSILGNPNALIKEVIPSKDKKDENENLYNTSSLPAPPRSSPMSSSRRNNTHQRLPPVTNNTSSSRLERPAGIHRLPPQPSIIPNQILPPGNRRLPVNGGGGRPVAAAPVNSGGRSGGAGGSAGSGGRNISINLNFANRSGKVLLYYSKKDNMILKYNLSTYEPFFVVVKTRLRNYLLVLGFNSSGSYGSSGRGSGSYGASGNGSASLYADMDENDGGAPPLDTSTQLYQEEEREKERDRKSTV